MIANRPARCRVDLRDTLRRYWAPIFAAIFLIAPALPASGGQRTQNRMPHLSVDGAMASTSWTVEMADGADHRPASARRYKREALTCPKDDTSLSGLMALLSAVPEYQAFFNGTSVAYVDYRALERSEDGFTATGWPKIAAMDDQTFQRWSEMMSRLTLDPLNLASEASTHAPLARTMPDVLPAEETVFGGLPLVLGFDWTAVDRALGIGLRSTLQPFRWSLLAGDDDLAAEDVIGQALSDHGLERAERNGVGVWHRFDDRIVAIDSVAPANSVGSRWVDPFAIRRGSATRIAALPCMVMGSPAWKITEDTIASAGGTARSLADNREFRAAAEAITDQIAYRGQLVQIRFQGPDFSAERVSEGRAGQDSTYEQRQTMAASLLDQPGGRLPPYQLVALADQRVGNDDVVVLILVYRHREAAELAAATLPRRLRGYQPIWWRMPLLEALEVEVGAHVVQSAGLVRFVTVVVMRDDGVEGATAPNGRLYRDMHRGLAESEASYLVPSQ